MSKVSFAFCLLAVGCSHEYSNYCENAPNHNCMDLGDGGGTACTTAAQCSGSTPVCDPTSKTCVACTSDQPGSCGNTTPVCTAEHTCRACVAHADCTSLACLPDGSCGTDATVAYVDSAGTDNTSCLQATPCTTIASALATAKMYVKIKGTIDEGVTIGSARQVTFLGDPNASLTRTSGTGAIITVTGDGTEFAVYDLTIKNAPNSASGYGIAVPTASGAPSVTVSRCELTNNPAGAISIAAGTFDITNTFIYRNGNTTSGIAGGAYLTPGGASKFEFNTLVDNTASSGAASAGGVFCDQGGFVAGKNLIFRNTGGGTGTAQTFGNCTYGNSFVAAGASTTDNAPGFAHPNSLPLDYHLTSTTPATIVDAAGACAGMDVDGDARPIGGGCDLGADEYKP